LLKTTPLSILLFIFAAKNGENPTGIGKNYKIRPIDQP
jgi:hypothetical protein